MKKILLFIDKNESVDRRVLEPTNYRNVYDDYQKSGANTGNKVWLSAVEKYLIDSGSDYDYFHNQSKEYINDNYRLVLFPCANRFRIEEKALKELEEWSFFFEGIKIPVYVIGIGAQAPDYSCLNQLVSKIGEVSKKFIDSVYKTGGKIAVRGYFTQRFCNRLGYGNVEVLGCPSMYSNGPDFQIVKKDIDKNSFKPVIVIKPDYLAIKSYSKIFSSYEKAILIDQNSFTKLLYGQFNNESFGSLINEYTYNGLSLFRQKRVKLFYDIYPWIDCLKSNKYNFCFGTRIHGNFISILSGIPSMVNCLDSRTKELAEFFNIPFIEKVDFKEDLFSLYQKCDYSLFNKTYREKYERFRSFMVENGIVKELVIGPKFLNLVSKEKYENPDAMIESNRERINALFDEKNVTKEQWNLLKRIKLSRWFSKIVWKIKSKKYRI